jgi:hypothetical protein
VYSDGLRNDGQHRAAGYRHHSFTGWPKNDGEFDVSPGPALATRDPPVSYLSDGHRHPHSSVPRQTSPWKLNRDLAFVPSSTLAFPEMHDAICDRYLPSS